MIGRINRLITIFLVVVIALYIVILNRNDITITFFPGSPFTANAGVILIGAFSLGIIATTLVALWFGIKAHFRERKLRGLDKQRRAFYEGMLEARSLLASHDLESAREHWESIIKKDPTDVIARVELSETYQALNNPLQALKVLDAARTADPDNIEVLFRAAESNIALGNKTAAVDNLALVLYQGPNVRAASMARDLSEELGRLEDAIEYHQRLEDKLGSSKEYKQILCRLRFKQILKNTASEQLPDTIKDFLRKNPDFVPAIQKLSSIYGESGKTDEAAQLLAKAARISDSPELWHEAQVLWLRGKMPEKALASAKTARNETKGTTRIFAEIDLIKAYLTLNMLDDARKAIDNFDTLLREQNVTKTKEIYQTLTILRGILLFRQGDLRESASIWKELLELELHIQTKSEIPISWQSDEAPAPHLSTP